MEFNSQNPASMASDYLCLLEPWSCFGRCKSIQFVIYLYPPNAIWFLFKAPPSEGEQPQQLQLKLHIDLVTYSPAESFLPWFKGPLFRAYHVTHVIYGPDSVSVNALNHCKKNKNAV